MLTPTTEIITKIFGSNATHFGLEINHSISIDKFFEMCKTMIDYAITKSGHIHINAKYSFSCIHKNNDSESIKKIIRKYLNIRSIPETINFKYQSIEFEYSFVSITVENDPLRSLSIMIYDHITGNKYKTCVDKEIFYKEIIKPDNSIDITQHIPEEQLAYLYLNGYSELGVI